VKANTKPITTLYTEILNKLADQLKLVYNDTKAVERTTQKLQTLKQRAKLFVNHLTDFDCTLLDAGGGDWPEYIKKAFLSNSLSSELYKALVANIPPWVQKALCARMNLLFRHLNSLSRNSIKL
jgi:hypothetical protein